MLKLLLKTAVAPLALCGAATAPVAAAPPLSAMALANPAMGGGEGAQGEAALMEMFAKLFDSGDKTPIDPAQLALGQATAAKLLPDGAYGKMMDQMLGTFMKPMLALDPGLTGSQIAAKTGIDYEAADALTEEQRNAIAAIIDPSRQARNEGMLALMSPLMREAGKALEPPMREGIARAYARKFSAAQLGEINAFFATPGGSAFAAESFAIQGDPEVLSATMQAMPVIVTKLMASGPEFEAKMKALPQERKLSELSAAELGNLAKLVGRTPAELNAYADSAEAEAAMMVDAAEAAGDAADAAEAAGDGETGIEPWFFRDQWAPADLAKVEALEKQSSDVLDATIAAEQAAIANAKARLAKKK